MDVEKNENNQQKENIGYNKPTDEEENMKNKSKIGMMNTNYLIILVAIMILINGAVLYLFNDVNQKIINLTNEFSSVKEQVTYLKNSVTTSSVNLDNKGNNYGNGSGIIKLNGYTFDLTGLMPRGDINAPVTIIEYSDFQCPFCGRAQPTVEQILKDYNGKVKLYYKQFPLTQIHPYSQKAAEASLLAAEQGKFWEYHDILFANQDKLDVTNLKQYAAQIGLDTAKFDSGLDSGSKAEQVSKDLQEGLTNGVQGTPTFFINGRVVSGAQPYSVFKQVIDEELKRIGYQ